MKNLLKVIFAALLVCTAAASCAKDGTPATADNKVNVNVIGQMCDPEVVVETKASASTVVRLGWEGGETVHAFAGNTKVGELTASLYKSDTKNVTLTGTLDGVPQGTQVITLIHSDKTVNFEDGKATVDLSSQDGTLSFVVYGTMPYNGTDISNELVNFKFATPTVLLTGTGIGTTGTANASINGVNTVCAITPSASGDPTIAGENSGKIAKTAGISASNDGRFTMNVALAPDASDATTTGRTIEVTMDGKTYESAYTTKKMEAKAYISTYAFTEQIILPYVVIPAKYDGETVTDLKWYRQNLAISPSGYKSWKGYNSSAVKVPGTDEDVWNGDYFQWAAYEGYAQVEGQTVEDRGLLIYESFTSKFCGDDTIQGTFTFKVPETGYLFYFFTSNSSEKIGISPYYDKTNKVYEKYTSGEVNLENTDDAANIILGGSWRMPTTDEFKALVDATYWAWDEIDYGFYVFTPDDIHTAGTNVSSIPEGLSKSDALLFFPTATQGEASGLLVQRMGYYWSSTLSDTLTGAYFLEFESSDIYPQAYDYRRCYGRSVRPVSE